MNTNTNFDHIHRQLYGGAKNNRPGRAGYTKRNPDVEVPAPQDFPVDSRAARRSTRLINNISTQQRLVTQQQVKADHLGTQSVERALTKSDSDSASALGTLALCIVAPPIGLAMLALSGLSDDQRTIAGTVTNHDGKLSASDLNVSGRNDSPNPGLDLKGQFSYESHEDKEVYTRRRGLVSERVTVQNGGLDYGLKVAGIPVPDSLGFLIAR